MKQKSSPDTALRRRAVAIVSLILVVALFGVLTWVLYRQLLKIGGTPEDFKSFIDSFGVTGWLVALGIQFLQVLIALIPGELVEIGMGCAFGAVRGTLLCLAGVALASAVVFLLTRRFGMRFLELFFPAKKIDSLRFINSEKKLEWTVFLLFFIPGTPKDLLTYFVGLTRMRLSQFLMISLVARIPSVVSSVIGGNLISSGSYVAAVILFAVTGAVSLLGILLYNILLRHKRLAGVPKTVRRVTELFLKICSIPHGSGNTMALSAYCLRFAKRHKLTADMDAAGNVWIERAAAPGFENAPPLILQAHLDMVCEKEPASGIDFRREPIQPVFEKDSLRADGTTLGADDGIGVAMILSVLEDTHLPHPPLQAVLTVDEETGMKGASELDASRLRGRRLISLDAEEEGVLIAGCAGLLRMSCTLPLAMQQVTGQAVTLSVSGLTGGHSGMDIDKGHANAITLLVGVLQILAAAFPCRLSALSGGSADNAIPIAATATVVLPTAETAGLTEKAAALAQKLQSEWSVTDPHLSLTAELGAEGTFAACAPAALLEWLAALPNGVQQMNPQFPGKPETSLNIGVISLQDDAVTVQLLLRSFRDKALAVLAQRLEKLTAGAGGSIAAEGCPCWEYRKKSPLRDRAAAVFENIYGQAPQIDVVHAGLECGILCGRLPDLECISIGPNITGAHTPAEQVSLSSLERTYRYLLALLAAE